MGKGYRLWSCIVLFLALVGCAPAPQESLQTIPTLFPSPTPHGQDLESANRVAVLFLNAWQQGDLFAMYSYISFASQEANPFDAFQTLYENTHTTMMLESLSYTANTLYRESNRVAVFNYNVDFVTTVMGRFSDTNRDLRLVFDIQGGGEWRVAWTPGDIFKEMEGGGALRLERFSVNRGNIYDSSGEVVLADQQGRVVLVNVVKRKIPQYDACVDLLVQTTGRSKTLITAILEQAGNDWDTEVGTIEPADYLSYEKTLIDTCAATFKPLLTRRYPNGTLAPHVVGYVGYPSEEQLPDLKIAGFNQDSILGRSGVEQSWDTALRGTPGGRLIVVSPDGLERREVARTVSQPQQSLWLTLDADLQQYALQVIGEAYAAASESWGKNSKGAALVVMDVQTGAILAMVSWPSYDANALNPYPAVGKNIAEQIKQQISSDIRVPLLNRPVQGVYPVGSVMKTIDSIAVADSGVYTTDQKYRCGGSWNRDIFRRDWLAGGHGTVTLAQALTGSCNPYFYEVGYQMDLVDPFLLPTYAKKLGLGAATGLRDVQEAAGLIPDPEWKRINTGLNWSFSDSVNLAVGQGELQVTPLQITRVFSLVANGGTLLRPQLVAKVAIVGEAAPSYVMQPDMLSELVIKPEVLDTVRQGLCNVTSQRGGTAEHIFRTSDLQLIGVCGKTGTAEDPANVSSHAWFAAYAPRENPQIAIAVIVENSGDGSAVAAPIVRRVLEYYFFGTKNPYP